MARKVMQANKGRDTKPELRVRSLLHALGYRFRVQVASLPGKPDVAFTKRRCALLIHGCFWHHHSGCQRAFMPKTRTAFWTKKFSANVDRDARVMRALAEAGWRVRVIWECETRDPSELSQSLVEFLGPTRIDPASSDV